MRYAQSPTKPETTAPRQTYGHALVLANVLYVLSAVARLQSFIAASGWAQANGLFAWRPRARAARPA
eukprot:4897453-Lingulodinium_polyedra.AAC.1